MADSAKRINGAIRTRRKRIDDGHKSVAWHESHPGEVTVRRTEPTITQEEVDERTRARREAARRRREGFYERLHGR